MRNAIDRKSTRLNSSHSQISYAVFCLKKKNAFEKVGSSKTDHSDVVEAIFGTIKATAEEVDKVKISGFGNFNLRNKRARRGRNPQTGGEITIHKTPVMTFKPSQILKDYVNSGGRKQGNAS